MSAMTYILESDVEIQDKFAQFKLNEDHVSVSGRYTSDSVAKFKLTWKAEQAMRRVYHGLTIVLNKPKFYCTDGNSRYELGRKEY